jgi:hypothetical protein
VRSRRNAHLFGGVLIVALLAWPAAAQDERTAATPDERAAATQDQPAVGPYPEEEIAGAVAFVKSDPNLGS